jgi:hypothetical protein
MSPTAAPPIPTLAPPTLATAGGETCRLGEAIQLGPREAGDAAIAFDGHSGVVAWVTAHRVIAVQAIARDGSKVGAAGSVGIPDDVEAHAAFAVNGRFVIVLRNWDWQAGHVTWWAVVAGRDGQIAGAATRLALDDLDIASTQLLDSGQLALQVVPAYISKNRGGPAHWQAMSIDGSGGVTLTPINAPPPVMPSPDAIAFEVFNGAEPPPPGAGGRINEAMGEPILERKLAGKRVGQTTYLDAGGDPIVHGMYVKTAIVWSGTHFLYPFMTDVAQILPIDCKP